MTTDRMKLVQKMAQVLILKSSLMTLVQLMDLLHLSIMIPSL